MLFPRWGGVRLKLYARVVLIKLLQSCRQVF
jgi:hypothetical protein